MIHQLKTQVEIVELIRDWHSPLEEVDVNKRKFVDFLPGESGVIILDEVRASAPDTMNQVMRVELKGSAVVDGSVIDPVEQFALLFGSDKVVVTLVANVCRCFGHAHSRASFIV